MCISRVRRVKSPGAQKWTDSACRRELRNGQKNGQFRCASSRASSRTPIFCGTKVAGLISCTESVDVASKPPFFEATCSCANCITASALCDCNLKRLSGTDSLSCVEVGWGGGIRNWQLHQSSPFTRIYLQSIDSVESWRIQKMIEMARWKQLHDSAGDQSVGVHHDQPFSRRTERSYVLSDILHHWKVIYRMKKCPRMKRCYISSSQAINALLIHQW